MKKFLLTLFFTSLFFACVPEDHVLEVEIVNNTSEPVREIKLLTAEDRVSFAADVLPAGEDIAHTLEVKGAVADGNYTFRFTRSNGNEELVTGSYVEDEEGALKKKLVFEIQEEGVNINHEVLDIE